MTTYDEIMGVGSTHLSAANSLSQRLVAFRQWLTDEAKAEVNPAICIVNGEATDGTRNAPVLVFERHESSTSSTGGIATSAGATISGGGTTDAALPKKAEGRVGIVDGDGHASLYDRTMGCQLRAVREIKKDEVLLVLPRTSMITPDLVAASDAGKAVLSCCQPATCNTSFWDALANTTDCETKFSAKVARNTGPQTLVKILQERKKAEAAFKSHVQRDTGVEGAVQFRLAEYGTISTRAPFLAFLIHQRFSDTAQVPVSKESFLDTARHLDGNAFRTLEQLIQYPPNAPMSFSPYARTLPSFVSVLLCWKRNELALLAGCIPGLALLQEVGSTTLHLVAEFMALLDAGILERFPEIFPPGVLTWERWVWAAAVFGSRNLPASSYIGENAASPARESAGDLEFQSPLDVWNEIGVMIPLLDMLNHEAVNHQVTWTPIRAGNDGSIEYTHPKAMAHKKVKKGSEIFCNYGTLSNANLILQYGFAQMSNSSDEVRLGWALTDAVGNVDPPFDYVPPYIVSSDDIFESNDETAVNIWWSDDRTKLLEREAFSSADSKFLQDLKARKKVTTIAYSDGNYHPILLSAAVIATMPANDVQRWLSDETTPISLSKRHQRVLQRYLQYSFTRKLEKLLQNLDNGLKGHFSNVKLWTKAASGGLNYQREGDVYTGWQSFFDTNAYRTAMEVENRYYAMGIDSCVLALYDGQVRALQVSLDGVSDTEKFHSGVLKQLEDLSFVMSAEDNGMEGESDEVIEREDTPKQGGDDANAESNGDSPDVSSQNGATGNKTPRNRKRNRRKNSGGNSNDRPPAVKLHIGSLAYTTTPSDLYDYFSSIYGQDNVLECHIPTERETGRSRGFGFVAMPEAMARRALNSGRRHEVDGRVLKIARSNSAGTVSLVKVPEGPKPVAADRCATCGYRPKYCICPPPNAQGQNNGPPGYGGPPPYPPHRFDMPPGYDRGPRDVHHGPPPDYYRDDRYRGGGEDRQYRDRQHHRDDDYRRNYDRDDDYHRERGRRDRGRDRSRSLSRSPESRSSSRRWEHDDRDRLSSRRDARDSDDKSAVHDRSRKRSPSRSHSRSRSRSRSKEKSSRRKKSKRRNRSRSRTNNLP